MKIGTMHRLSLSGTPAVAALGVMSGSVLLAGAGLALIAVLALASGQLLAQERSKVRTWSVHGVTVLLLGAAVLLFRTTRIDAVLLVVMLGIFNRFVLRQGARDDLIIAGAASVLMAATTTITAGVIFALLIVVYVPVMLWALWTSTMLAGAQRVSPAQAAWTLRQISQRDLPAQRAFIAGASLGLMLLGFVVVSAFPRYHFGRIFSAGYFMPLPGAHTSMTLQSGGVRASGAGAVVLRVEPNDGKRGGLEGLYARLHALDQFDGETWTVNPDPVIFKLNEGHPTSEVFANTVSVSQERLVARGKMQPISTLGYTFASAIRLQRASHNLSGGWFGWFPATASKLSYTVDLGTKPEMVQMPSYQRDLQAVRLVALPDSLDPRLRALSLTLTQGLSQDADKIAAVLAHFDRGYSYSLDPLEGEAEDALVRFVFEAKRGHCELYAGAVAVLLRASGVKARVATGYYGGWWNSSGGYLEFSEVDAHAWVEAYDPERGWIWADATPEDLRARRENKPFAWFRDVYDALEAAWYEHVIDFDERKRRALLGQLAETLKTTGTDWFSFAEGSGQGASRTRSGAGWIAVVLVVVGLAVGAGAVLGLRRRPPTGPELGRRLRRALDPEATADLPLGTLFAQLPAHLEASAREAIRLYEALRFDHPARAPDSRAVVVAVRALEQARRG